MPLFSGRKRKETAPVSSATGGERMYSLATTVPVMGACEAFSYAQPLAHAVANNRRLFLVLAGNEVDDFGRSTEWQFHYIYPEEHVEAIVTVMTAQISPIAGSAAIVETVTAWPPPGSVQQTMLQFQGPAARLIVEQQWNDRLDRLPGLPEEFIDSTVAMDTFRNTGADLRLGGGIKLKGRTPPGGAAVWEALCGFEVLHTPFAAIRRHS
jgi:hypothetical protein